MMSKAVFIDPDGGATLRIYYGNLVVDQPAVACEECEGSGVLKYEEPVPDYVHGSYITSTEGECFACGGYGFVVDQDDEEEA